MATSRKFTVAKRPAQHDSAAQVTDLLRDIATGITATGDPDFFPSLVRYLAKSLGVAYAFVAELIDAPPRARTIAFCADGEIAANFDYELRDTPSAMVTRKGLCIYAEGAQRLFPKDHDLAQWQAESYVGIPLFGIRGENLGLLCAIGREPLRNKEGIESLLQILAVQAAAEFERRRSQDQILKLNRLLHTIIETNKMIARETDEQRMFVETCRILVEHGGFRMAWIGSAQPSGEVQPVAAAGASGDYLTNIGIRHDDSPAGQGPTGTAIRTGQYVVNNDCESNPQFAPWAERARAFGYRSTAAFPLRQGERVIGAISVYATEPQAFGSSEVALLQGLAGDISYALQSAQETAARRRAEEALGENQRVFATLLSNLPGMVYRCGNDKNWTMEFASDGCLALTGYPASDFIGNSVRSYGEIVHPDDQARVWEEVQQGVADNRVFQLVYRIRTAGGGYKWVWEHGTGVRGPHGDLICLEGFITDITERKQAEEALRTSEERFQHATRATTDTIWDWDLVTNALWWNENFRTMFDYKAEEVEPGIESWTNRIHPQDKERVLSGLHVVIDRAGQFWSDEYRFRRGDGRYAMIFDRGYVVRDRNGKPVRMIGAMMDITERKQAEEVLRESEERFRSLTQLSSDYYWQTDAKHRFVMRSLGDRATSVSVFPTGTHIGKTRWELPYVSPSEAGWRAHRVTLDAHLPFHDFRFSRLAPDGTERHFSVSGEPVFDAASIFKGYRGIGTDITERIRAEAEMRKLSSAIQQTADCVLITDRDGVIEYVNAAFERTTGYTRAEALGRTPRLVNSGLQESSFFEQLWRTILAGTTFSEVFVNRKKNGELYYEEKTITPLRDGDGQITHFISTGKDITERMQAQERLHYLAHHDALTELPNRVLFLDRLNQALNRAHRNGRIVGIMFLDLDRFKNINDTLGHDVGDALLKALAVRLRGCVREGDSVARFGGDEFAILLEDIAHVEDVSVVADKVLNAFTQPFMVHARELFVTPSIGISLYPTDGTAGAVLLKNADAAMYRAKDAGKNNYQFYSADMTTAAFERLTLETSLRHALARGEFVLHYQPQIELATGRVIGVEALVRWQHPEFGLLAPAHFITIAEETGAIVPLGGWVARTAMLQTKCWREAGLSQLRVSVNVSARQFNEPNFVETIVRLLRETDLPADALELEITESVIMKNAEKTIERLQALHSMGVHFAVDDFGTGYSSLSYLRRFPIHTLKVDQSFIRDLAEDSGDAEIVKTIIVMARGLKLAVVAEGVETYEQLVFLQVHGCHAVQGYFVSRPLTVERMTERLNQGDARPWLG